MKKKKIWIFHYQEPPLEGLDSVNRRLWRANSLAEELAGQGHHVLRWRSSFNHYKKMQLHTAPFIENIRGVNQVYIPTVGYVGHFSFRRILSHYLLGQRFIRVVRYFEFSEPDIIHICNVPPELLLHVSRYARSRGIPLIVDVRDLWPEAYANIIPNRFDLLRKIVRRLLVLVSFRYKSVIRQATALTSISEDLLKYLLRNYGRMAGSFDRVFYIGAQHTILLPSNRPNTFDEVLDDCAAVRVIGTAKKLIYVGNIGFQTDFERIISLARSFYQRNFNVEITICGDGPRLKELRGKCVDVPNVKFTGWLDGDKLREELDNADFGIICFFPNFDFQLSIPSKVSEYLSSTRGLLCISDGAVRSLIADHGVGIDCFGMSNEEIVDLMADYFQSPEIMDRLLHNSRMLYQSCFVQKEITKKMAAHLLRVAEGG